MISEKREDKTNKSSPDVCMCVYLCVSAPTTPPLSILLLLLLPFASLCAAEEVKLCPYLQVIKVCEVCASLCRARSGEHPGFLSVWRDWLMRY